MKRLIQRLRQSVLPPGERDRTDGQLLERFVERRDEDAFEALVRLHGPMVFGVCLRILGHRQDAEDAFQATFLVLARKGGSVVPRAMVGNWLYGVARRTALKLRGSASRRKGRERQVPCLPEPAAGTPDAGHELWPILDQELGRLPDKQRAPVVLCDLEGKTHKEAARLLGWPEGTLSVRLMRARGVLARRLARHGLALTVGALAEMLARQEAWAGLPPTLVGATVRAGVLSAAGPGAVRGLVSEKVLTLTEGVVKAMFLTKLKLGAAVLLIGGVLCAGAVVSARALDEKKTAPEDKSTSPAPAKDKAPAERQPDRADEKRPDRAPGNAGAGMNSRVRALREERLAALKECAAEKEKMFQNSGTLPYEEVVEAKILVHQAELEMCQTDKEWVVVQAKIVALAREREDVWQKRFDAGRIPHFDLLNARAKRLEAEIALELGKSGKAPR